MEQHPQHNEQEKPNRPPLYINLLEEGRNIFTVISMAEEVLVEQLFNVLNSISEEIIRGEEVTGWGRFHAAAIDIALLKKDIVDRVGPGGISRHHDQVLGIVNRHVELIDLSGVYPEFGGQKQDGLGAIS